MLYGYAYDGPKAEPLESQLVWLGTIGVPAENIYIDRHSRPHRPARATLTFGLAKDDVVAVASPAVLGAKTRERESVLSLLAAEGVLLALPDAIPRLYATREDYAPLLERATQESRAWNGRRAGPGGGRPAKKRLTGEDADAVRKLWHDMNVLSSEVLAECARRGAPDLTVHNLRADWGPRRRKARQ